MLELRGHPDRHRAPDLHRRLRLRDLRGREPAVLSDSRWRAGPAALTKLLAGLWLFGTGEAMLVSSELGNSPWTVLAEGVAVQTPLAIGVATVAISFLVLLAWIPLRQRPGPRHDR